MKWDLAGNLEAERKRERDANVGGEDTRLGEDLEDGEREVGELCRRGEEEMGEWWGLVEMEGS